MTIEIRLDRHVGVQTTPFGNVDVDLGQFFVMGREAGTDEQWLHLGYVCEPVASNPTPPFNGLEVFRTLPQTLKDDVVRQVAEKLGLVRVRSTEIPEPALILEEEIEEFDDEA